MGFIEVNFIGVGGEFEEMEFTFFWERLEGFRGRSYVGDEICRTAGLYSLADRAGGRFARG